MTLANPSACPKCGGAFVQIIKGVPHCTGCMEVRTDLKATKVERPT